MVGGQPERHQSTQGEPAQMGPPNIPVVQFGEHPGRGPGERERLIAGPKAGQPGKAALARAKERADKAAAAETAAE